MQTSSTKGNSLLALHKNSTSQAKLLELTRDFSVPIEQLYAAFTDGEVIKEWWWPKGLHADRVEFDFHEGGRYFINMKGFEKGGGGMTGRFEEIILNQLIVMTDQFADENGKPISAKEAKMPGSWPDLIYITFEFEANDENSSSLHLYQTGIPNEVQKDCMQGWSESFDKLEDYLIGRRH